MLKKYTDAVSNNRTDLIEAHKILKVDDPSKYLQWKVPALWTTNLNFDDITKPSM